MFLIFISIGLDLSKWKLIVYAAQDMNYTVVINGTLWGGALLFYMLHARKTYKGPQTTVGASANSSPGMTGNSEGRK